MYYGEIKNCDIANGDGVSVALFVSARNLGFYIREAIYPANGGNAAFAAGPFLY